METLAERILTLTPTDHEKMPSAVVADQPESHPKPLFGLGRRSESLNLSRLSKSPKKNSGANSAGGNNRFTFANRLRNPSDASSRRPLISAPTEFRHLDSGSGFLHQPSLDQPLLDQPSVRRGTASPERNRRPHGIDNEPGHRQTSVMSNPRPLELSIHMPHNRLSSLLPRFEVPTLSPSPTPTPPPAYARDESTSAYPSHASATLRSYPSSFSFHLPRKHHRDSPPGSPTGEAQMSAPRAKKGRPRSNTSSGVEAMKERVANAMREMEDLQKQIDDVVERQSMYSHSRPSSAHSMARTVPGKSPSSHSCPPSTRHLQPIQTWSQCHPSRHCPRQHLHLLSVCKEVILTGHTPPQYHRQTHPSFPSESLPCRQGDTSTQPTPRPT